jgi:hypothetical protein
MEITLFSLIPSPFHIIRKQYVLDYLIEAIDAVNADQDFG